VELPRRSKVSALGRFDHLRHLPGHLVRRDGDDAASTTDISGSVIASSPESTMKSDGTERQISHIC
jgi:hypothetical protein